MDSQTCLLAFLILANLSTSVLGDGDMYWCTENGNYTKNSTYHTNLNHLLPSLPSKMGDSGFYNSSIGQSPDQVYAVALCRADTQLDACRSCVQAATSELVKLCPNRKQAILWLEFCMLRYSNKYFIGNMSQEIEYAWAYTDNNVSSPHQFNADLRILLDNLTIQASSGGSWMKAAAGKRKGPDFMTIYALLQCTPDLSEQDCTNCLMTSANTIPTSWYGNSRGTYLYVPSCNIYYDVIPFYNITRVEEAQRMPSTAVQPVVARSPVLVPAPVQQVPSAPRDKQDNNTTRIVVIVIPIILSLILLSCFGIWLTKRRKKKLDETLAPNESIAESLRYEFNHIREATNNFSDVNKLGGGGFGAVYKGKLQNGQEIAVKRLLKCSIQGDLEFRNEVVLLAKLQHRNLVRLIGFAQEGQERVLIYDLIQNASLDQFLFDSTKAQYLDWNKRIKIIGGIAKGLLYLHEDSRLRIIHRDLKPSNILLDGEMNPKIGDFGLARLFESDECEVTTSRIAGTFGYMSPEYAMQGKFSIKSDVFSFGVLVLEIISGQRNNNFQSEDQTGESLLTYAWRNWHEGTITNVMDPVLKSTPKCFHEVLRCVHIALLCTQENASDRPATASIVLMLVSSTMTLPKPSKPAFSMPHISRSNTSIIHGTGSKDLKFSNARITSPLSASDNSVTVTELHPR